MKDSKYTITNQLWAFIRRFVAKPHGNFTPPAVCRSPIHCLRRFKRSDYGDKGVSLSFCAVVAHKAAALVLRRGVGRSFPVEGKSWRTRRVARYRKNVSDLPYTASPLSCTAFFVKVQKSRRAMTGCGKGGAT